MVFSEALDFEKSLLRIQHQDLGGNDFSSSSSSTSGVDFWSGQLEVDEDEEPKHLSPLNLLCLTISMGGLQTIWTAIMSQGSPYLASLNMNPAIISLVWLAGPMAGIFIQPYVGVLSDSCTHSWGRRKPFILMGTIATVTCMTTLPRTREAVEFLYNRFGGDASGRQAILMAQFLAAAWIWAMKISVQPIQCGIRALIVDHCPSDQQVKASAYASRVIGIGSIIGYAVGFVELPSLIPWLGDTQFKGLCAISSIALSLTVAIQCLMIRERKLEPTRAIGSGNLGVIGAFKQVLMTVEILPQKIRRICMVQFFAWLGWFPFLYYSTTYVGDLYRREILQASQVPLNNTPESLSHDATRYGTLSMVFFAVVAFVVNLVLPHFVSSSNPGDQDLPLEEPQNSLEKRSLIRRIQAIFLKRPKSISMLLTVRRAWICSHILSSVMLLLIGLNKNRILSTILVATLGFSWALTQWAPYALIGAELSKTRGIPTARQRKLSTTDIDTLYTSLENTEGDEIDLEKRPTGVGTEIQAGSILGVHNMAIAMPQIVAAFASSMLFWVFASFGIVGVDVVGWMLSLSLVPAAVAGWLAVGIEED